MKMDIACPVELLRFEEADFGEDRRQAYLTFLNESTYTVTALSGRLILLNAQEEALDDRRVSFGPLAARPGESFVCNLALDDYPAFYDAAMLVEDVLFDSAEPWALHPSRLKEYNPPVLEPGPARNALIAVAGRDAVCYPQKLDNMWICVCGRFNRWRWPVCRRCRRERDHVLDAFLPEHVGAAYSERLREEEAKPPQVLVHGSPRRRAAPQPPQKKKKRGWLIARAPRPKRPRPPRPQRDPDAPVIPTSWVAAGVGIALAALLIWGGISLFSRFADIARTDPAAQPQVDALY